ncbi:MAG TPA: hypothetical protein VFW80_10090 [Gaiellaceae bacterium]|nr:hypothetical protein [Gaiellaceae bacterium]
MTARRWIGLIALIAALACCATGLAAGPAEQQYENPGFGAGPKDPIDGGLPFTGMQAGFLLLAGLGAISAGVTLRGGVPGLERLRPVAALEEAPAAAAATLDLEPSGVRLERCVVCGEPFDPRGFTVALGAGRPGYHRLACAERARKLG